MKPAHEPGNAGGPTSPIPSPPVRTAIILHNFKRPQNLPRIVSACLKAGHRPDVIVIDNAPDDSLAAPLHAVAAAEGEAGAHLSYRANLENRGPGDRYSFATQLDHDAILSIDDDLFLTPSQIDALLDYYLRDRDRVHGIWGERVVSRNGGLYLDNGFFGREMEVDILNRAYAFGPAQARAACALLHDLGYEDWLSLGPGSDIVLSFCGERRPMLHDIGALESCETSDLPGVAFWRRDDFKTRRLVLFQRLLRMRPRRSA